MKFLHPFLLVLVGNVVSHSADDKVLEDEDLSLPDLEKTDVLDAPSWSISGNAKFENGRIIMTTGQNTHSYLTNDYELAYDSWTVESIFRSMGDYGQTSSSFTLSLTNEHSNADSSFFGSSSIFKGLKVVVDSDSKDGSSVHAYLNDGTIDFSKLTKEQLYSKSFGSCLLSYQESQVPTTLRISSYAGIFLVQVNNKVCVQTKSIKIPKTYKISLNAFTSSSSQEIFELFRLKTYGGVISEIIENQGKTAPRANKAETNKHTITEPEIEVNKPEIKPNNLQLSEFLSTIEDIQKSNDELLIYFQKFEDKINELSKISASEPKGRPELSHIAEQSTNIQKLVTSLNGFNDKFQKIEAKLINFDGILKSEIDSLASRIDQIHDFISGLKDHNKLINGLNNNINYLVKAEKENQTNLAISNLISGLKYLLLPILLVITVLSFYTYSLRHEIKQKLL